MISMVLEELELPGEYSDDDDDDDKDDEMILAEAWSSQLSFGSNHCAGASKPAVVPSQNTATG
jgi:hypothetical protein